MAHFREWKPRDFQGINNRLWSENVAHLYGRLWKWGMPGKGFQLYKLLVKLNLYGSAGIFWQIVYKLWPPRAYMHAKSCWGIFPLTYFLYVSIFSSSSFFFLLLPWEMARIWCSCFGAAFVCCCCFKWLSWAVVCRLIALKWHILWPGNG